MNKKEEHTYILLRGPEHNIFTTEKNAKILKEFCRTFDIEMLLIKTSDESVHVESDVKALVKRLCSNKPQKENIEFTILKTIVETTRLPSVPEAKKEEPPEKKLEEKPFLHIEDYIRSKLINSVLSLQMTRKQYEQYDYKTVYGYFTKVKNNMISEGWNVERISRGIWSASK